ncbi:MAG TPA: hypothetical protein VGH81_08260 [Rudaea sp.]|jgi:hypothetical protein
MIDRVSMSVSKKIRAQRMRSVHFKVCRWLADAVLSENLLQLRILRGALERNANATIARHSIRFDSDGIHRDEPTCQGNRRVHALRLVLLARRRATSRREDAQASRDS